MSLTLVSRPIEDTVYKWNTAKNPLVYEFATVSTGDNYRIQVEFYDTSDVLLYPDPFFYTPKSDGTLRIDVSDIILSLLDPILDLTATAQNQLAQTFYIIATEVSSAGTGDVINEQSNPVGAVLAQNQFLENSNLKDYTPVVNQITAGFTIENQGQFLTRFEEPSKWIGWPSNVYVIANDHSLTPGVQRAFREQPLDANKDQLLGKTDAILDPIINDEINRIQLKLPRLNANEQYREISTIIGISLKQVIEAVNLNTAWPETPVSTMREAGTALENNTAYTRSPPGTGPDSLLELATFI